MSLYNQLRAFEHQEKLLSAQLNHLLGHAQKTAPFWTELLATRSTGPLSLQERLSEIAPLTRKELQVRNNELSSKFTERDRSFVTESST